MGTNCCTNRDEKKQENGNMLEQPKKSINERITDAKASAQAKLDQAKKIDWKSTVQKAKEYDYKQKMQ